MATMGMPDPSQGPQGAPGASAPSQAPAPPELMQLAKISQFIDTMAQSNPLLSAGLAKAKQGIQEAQAAMVSQGPQQQPQQTPPY